MWEKILDKQYKRDDYTMTREEIRALADELDLMRQSVNVHNRGAFPGSIYEQIQSAELGVLAELYGKRQAGKIMEFVIDCGEPIQHALNYLRNEAEWLAYPCGSEFCKISARRAGNHEYCPEL